MRIEYRIRGDGNEKRFLVELDSETLALVTDPRDVPPSWAALSEHRCPHCRIPDNEPFCPAAVSLAGLLGEFRDAVSFDRIEARVLVEAREYRAATTLQQVASSLMGIYMAGSGCPSLARLRPMVKYHLPFATGDETRYRVLSMYALAQTLVFREGGRPDLECDGLLTLYNEIHAINTHMAARLRAEVTKDASLNAIVNLDCLAGAVTYAVRRDALDDLKTLFAGYLGT